MKLGAGGMEPPIDWGYVSRDWPGVSLPRPGMVPMFRCTDCDGWMKREDAEGHRSNLLGSIETWYHHRGFSCVRLSGVSYA